MVEQLSQLSLSPSFTAWPGARRPNSSPTTPSGQRAAVSGPIALRVMWVVVIDPASQANWSDWPDKRVFGPFSRHMDAERVAFEMNEGFQEDRVAKAVEVLPASAAPKVD
jgi:hypothetical protein